MKKRSSKYKDLGIVIRAKRKKKDISQGELAKYARVTQGSLSKIERGETSPRIDTAILIFEKLRMNLAAVRKILL